MSLLVNVVRVPAAGTLAPGAIVSIPHGLNAPLPTGGNAGLVPTIVQPWSATNIIVNFADDTNVTFQNTDVTAGFAYFRCHYDHSIQAQAPVQPLWWRGIAGSASPSGPASGDLAGTYPAPTVDGFASRPIDTGAPAAGDYWQYDGTTWRHVAVSPGTQSAVYGQFYSNIDQPIADGGVGISVLYFESTSPGANGVSVVDPGTGPSRITVASAGVYAFTLSPQFFKSAGAGSGQVTFWARKNGSDITESCSFVTITNNQHVLPFIELMYPMGAGDYIEWVAHANTVNVTLEQEPESFAPAIVRPAAPSVIAGVKLIGV